MFWFCQFDLDKVLSGFDSHKRRSIKGVLHSNDWNTVQAANQHLLKLGLIRWDNWGDDVFGDQDILVAV